MRRQPISWCSSSQRHKRVFVSFLSSFSLIAINWLLKFQIGSSNRSVSWSDIKPYYMIRKKLLYTKTSLRCSLIWWVVEDGIFFVKPTAPTVSATNDIISNDPRKSLRSVSQSCMKPRPLRIQTVPFRFHGKSSTVSSDNIVDVNIQPPKVRWHRHFTFSFHSASDFQGVFLSSYFKHVGSYCSSSTSLSIRTNSLAMWRAEPWLRTKDI